MRPHWRRWTKVAEWLRAASPKKPEEPTVENLLRLLEQMRAGTITPADRELANRCLARYRLSARSAQRLGLIDTDPAGNL